LVKVLIAAGGTGGHIFPALSIARSLQRKTQEAEVEFVGTSGEMEAKWWQAAGFAFHRIEIRGLKGKRLGARMRSLALLPHALGRSWAVLSQALPQVAVGVGGYVSGPLVLVAAIRGIPTLIHEQNFFPGLTNRLLAPLVRKVALSFPESAQFFPWGRGKSTYTGNPIRREILEGKREEAGKRFEVGCRPFTILIFGGSQGASRINGAALEALAHLSSLREEIQFLHASGERDLAEVREGYANNHFRAKVYPFFEDMASAYALADLVISRAGAGTIAELMALGKPSILVPYPHAANDHQRLNAEVLVSRGGARWIPDQDLDGPCLARMIEEAFRDPQGRETMGRRAKSLAKIDADEKIAELIMELASHP
jgi:UDP-N-acetylglucosamine--N-acetylmuramyl-(pentapeptide) pyrophosphoryl-undecaprenol N-acetylglucosamine transferase